MKSRLIFASLLVVSALFLQPAPSGIADSSGGPDPIDLLKKLSSPAFEGRGVGTQGLNLARDLIVNELSRAGLEPGFLVRDHEGHATGKSYTQSFALFTGSELGPHNSFASSRTDEFLPLSFSRSGSVEKAEVVFAGYGITMRGESSQAAAEPVYDDYAGIDVKGKIAVVVLGDPSVGNDKSVFRNPSLYYYSTPVYKVQNAQLHGAAGVLLVRDAYSLADDPEPALRYVARQGGGSVMDVLAGQIRISLAERIIGKRVSELQQEIAASQKPLSFAVSGSYGLSVDLKREVGQVDNIAAYLPGTDPSLASEFVVIGAHYDHLGYGGDSSMDPNGIGKIHPGADDNASGVQAVYDIARRIKTLGTNRRPIVFLFFTAEEIGLLGSKHWLETVPLPVDAPAAPAKVAFMINLDMVGRLNENQLNAFAIASAKEFEAVLQSANAKGGFKLLVNKSGMGSSDHASFLQSKIPSLFFTTGAHRDYHRPSDTSDKINVAGLGRVEGFVEEVWRELDQRSPAPEYTPGAEDPVVPQQGHGYGSYFGSVPDFEQPPVPGVLLSGVRSGSPAETAGLQKGDIVTGMGEIEIHGLTDLVFALRFYRPNEEIEVRWLRNMKPMKGRTKLKPRQEI